MIKTTLLIIAYMTSALVCVLWSYKHLSIFRLRANVRMLSGFAFTPMLLACVPLVCTFFIPGTNAITPFGLLITLGALYLYLNRYYLKKMSLGFKRDVYNQLMLLKPTSLSSLLLLILFICCSLVFIVMLCLLVHNANSPMNDHDGTVYFYEALPFAKSRLLSLIPGFNEPLNHVVRNNPHTYLFQSLISFGLMAGKGHHVGYPYDLAARYLVQSVLLSLLASLAAISLFYKKTSVTAISIVILALLPFVGTMSATANRDAFRLLPIGILMLLLLTMTKNKLKLNWSHGLILGIISAFAILAHTLNITNLILLGFVFLPFMLYKYKAQELAKILFLVVLFDIVAFIPYLINYVMFKSFYGFGMTFLATKGTVLQNFEANKYLQSFISMNFISSVIYILKEYGFIIPLLTVLCSFLTIIFTLLKKLKPFYMFLPLVFLFYFFIPLMMSSNVTGFSLKTAMLMNYRYPLSYMILCGVIIATSFQFIYVKFSSILWKSKTRSLVCFAALALTTVFFTVTAIGHIVTTWKPNYNVRDFLNQTVFTLKPYISKLNDNENWFTDNLRMAYYYNKHPIFAYSYHWDKLLRAKNTQQVEKLIHKWNIKLFIIYKYDKLFTIHNILPLNKVLNSQAFTKTSTYWWAIYQEKTRVKSHDEI